MVCFYCPECAEVKTFTLASWDPDIKIKCLYGISKNGDPGWPCEAMMVPFPDQAAAEAAYLLGGTHALSALTLELVP